MKHEASWTRGSQEYTWQCMLHVAIHVEEFAREIQSFTALLDGSSMTLDTREDYVVAQRIGL